MKRFDKDRAKKKGSLELRAASVEADARAMQELVMAAIEDAQIVQTRRDVTMLVPALFLDDPFFPLHVISLLLKSAHVQACPHIHRPLLLEPLQVSAHCNDLSSTGGARGRVGAGLPRGTAGFLSHAW